MTVISLDIWTYCCFRGSVFMIGWGGWAEAAAGEGGHGDQRFR